jgi:hypothetical protein
LSSCDFQAFLLAKSTIGTQKDIVVINAYNSPTSSYKIKKSAKGESAPTLSKLDAPYSSLPQEYIYSLLFITRDMNYEY